MDIVVTIPKPRWTEWLTEGDLADGTENPAFWDERSEYGLTFGAGASVPKVQVGERLYIVAHGQLRGYAPITEIDTERPERFGGEPGGFAIVRRGDAVAVRLPLPVKGFQGYRYRWWNPEVEIPFPDWKQP
jgi:hypothetical protein